MTTLTMDAPLRFIEDDVQMDVWNIDTSAAQTFYKGSPCILDVSADTVNITHWVDQTHPTISGSNDVFIGIAMHKKVVALGDNETLSELTLIYHGEVGFKSAVFTDADAGKVVYMSDNGTLTATSTNNLKIGQLVRVREGYAYVMINTAGAPTIQ